MFTHSMVPMSAQHYVAEIISRCLNRSGVHASHGMERTHISAVENTLKLLILI